MQEVQPENKLPFSEEFKGEDNINPNPEAATIA